MDLRLDDGLRALLLRPWSPPDPSALRLPTDDRETTARLLRRLMLEPSARRKLQRLWAEIDPFPFDRDDEALVAALSRLLLTGSLELIRLPHDLVYSRPAEQLVRIEPDETSLGKIEASIRMAVDGRIITLDLDVSVGFELSEKQIEIEPKLQLPPIHDIDTAMELEPVEHQLDVGLELPDRHGEDVDIQIEIEWGEDSGPDGGLGSGLETGLELPDRHSDDQAFDTGLELPPESDTQGPDLTFELEGPPERGLEVDTGIEVEA